MFSLEEKIYIVETGTARLICLLYNFILRFK